MGTGRAGVIFAELLPIAAGIAANPPAVIAVILLLSAPESRTAAVAFAAGWVVGIAAVALVVLALGDTAEALGDPSVPMLWLRLGLGVGLVVLGVRKWVRRREPASDEAPRWMTRLAGLSAAKAFRLAALYAAFNPKTLALSAAGALVIVNAYPQVTTQLAILGAFVLVSSATVVIPVAYALIARQRADATLAAVEGWLIANSAPVVAVVVLVIGVVLVQGAAQKLLAT